MLGSLSVVTIATEGLKDVVGASFVVEPDPVACADAIVAPLNGKRKALGLPV